MGIALKGFVLLTKYRMLLPYITAQAKHETGNFTSSVYKNLNNMFGMKHPTVRQSVGVQGTLASDGGYYQKYNSDLDSLHDLFLWMNATNFPTGLDSIEDYAKQLKARNYFGASLEAYTNGLKYWSNH